MSQHDYAISNASGATVRADINALAEAIATNNSGASGPSVTFPYMFWMDTTNSLLKIRNGANSAWITVATISGSTMTLAASLFSVPASGSWFGTTNRVPFLDTSGILEVGGSIDFHPDAAGTEDYRVRISRAPGADGALTITNTGAGGVNLVPGAGGFTVDGTGLDPIPFGIIAAFGGASAPTGWLLCYGQNVSRTTYASLFTAISTTWGVGDGSTTFTLPDLRGRVIAGQDNMGGSSANRLTGLSGGVNGDTLAASGGAESHTLTEAQLAAHDHAVDPPNTTSASGGSHSHTFPIGSAFGGGQNKPVRGNTGGDPETGTTDTVAAHTHAVDIASFASGSAGSGSAHNNVQPTTIANYIIFAGV